MNEQKYKHTDIQLLECHNEDTTHNMFYFKENKAYYLSNEKINYDILYRLRLLTRNTHDEEFIKYNYDKFNELLQNSNFLAINDGLIEHIFKTVNNKYEIDLSIDFNKSVLKKKYIINLINRIHSTINKEATQYKLGDFNDLTDNYEIQVDQCFFINVKNCLMNYFKFVLNSKDSQHELYLIGLFLYIIENNYATIISLNLSNMVDLIKDHEYNFLINQLHCQLTDLVILTINSLQSDYEQDKTIYEKLNNFCYHHNTIIDKINPHNKVKIEDIKQSFHKCYEDYVNNYLSNITTLIEIDPYFSDIAGSLLRNFIKLQTAHYSIEDCFKIMVDHGFLEPKILVFISQRHDYYTKLAVKCDEIIEKSFRDFISIKTLLDRYLIKIDSINFIEPLHLYFMRIIIGVMQPYNLCVFPPLEVDQLSEMICSKLFMPSSPTLFNSGKEYNQLSSCFISTIQDDLQDIFKAYSDNALMAKFAGGIGNDWSNIRASNSEIKKTDGKSQGLIPFLKISNDVTLAVDQSGKRRGANCAYLEPWHLEIEDFIDLKKNTGDERRRCHDMNTALWCPNLLFERIKDNDEWTLFCPSIAYDKEKGINILHEAYGKEFDTLYTDYEDQASKGLISKFKTVRARDLWKKILASIYETGHPWITYKDSSNIRYPARHKGVIHSSNLCCEVFLHNSSKEISVCNLCSINIHAIYKKYINHKDLLPMYKLTSRRILNRVNDMDFMFMIKNMFKWLNEDYNYFSNIVLFMNKVIDNNYYPVEEARVFNINNRPIGIGLMGFQDLLFELNVSYDHERAEMCADKLQALIMEFILKASCELCQSKKLAIYNNFVGSDWFNGFLSQDTLQRIVKDGSNKSYKLTYVDYSKEFKALREEIKKGVSNSTFFAIAPTVTISNICGVYQSIEPCFSNIFVKGNIGGNFTIVNKFLVKRLKNQGLWNQEMIDLIKFYDGSIQKIDKIDDETKQIFKTAFELDQKALIRCAAARMKFIDMGHSLNLYINTTDAKYLSDLYMYCYELGLKSTYYVRTKSSNTIEKSTIETKPAWATDNKTTTEACSVEEECSSCQ